MHRWRPAIGLILHRRLPDDRAPPTVLSRFAAIVAEPEDGTRGRSAKPTEAPGGAAGPDPVHGQPRGEQARLAPIGSMTGRRGTAQKQRSVHG